VLFVCMGNICRSPAAEGVMQHLLKEHKLDQSVRCDSAGTIGFHSGCPADGRMQSHARRRGIELLSRSRKFDEQNDFDKFDYIVVMDKQNWRDVKKLDHGNKYADKIFMMTDFCQKRSEKEVPDPYYDGGDGFELVLDIIEDAASGLLARIKADLERQST